MSKIKWASIQPLTGGMYLGAEEAIGHPAEFILSYKGLSDVKYKDDDIFDAGNEYNLLEYLKKHNRCPRYYQMNKNMFDTDFDNMHPDIYLDDVLETPNYEGLDLVVAVPVCSGLSIVTSGSADTKNSKNCNMLWISKYTLSVIRPNIYIFENAPTLMGSRGDELRAQFEAMAKELGYSILYYKTDTRLHHNCQSRVRTFIVFFKRNLENTTQQQYLFDWENAHVSVKDFFDAIDNDNLTQNEPVQSSPHNYMLIDFVKQKCGAEWMELTNGDLMGYCIENKYLDEFIEFVKTSDYTDEVKTKTIKYIEHIKYKKSLGLNYFCNDVFIPKEKFPSVQFRSIPNMLHYTGTRFCSCREYLSLMGMPSDFTLYGKDKKCLNKIGQNVPVKTAKFIVEQAVKHLQNLNSGFYITYQDNTKQKLVNYKQ